MKPVQIRASAIADFLDCAARAEAKHLLGKRTPASSKAFLGSAFHASTAVYDKSVLTGAGITVDEAAGAAVDYIRKPREDVAMEDDDDIQQVEDIAVALHTRYCEEIAPTQQYVAVEVTCDKLEITDLGLILTGTTDRIARHGDDLGVRDLKTGGNAVSAAGHVNTKGHAYQIGIYEMLAETANGVPINAPAKIIGAQTGKTARGQRVAVSQDITGARDALVGDEESPGVLQAVSHMIHSGIFVGNPRSILCGEKFCPIFSTCRFRR